MEDIYGEGSKNKCYDTSFLNANNNSKSKKTENSTSNQNIVFHMLMTKHKSRPLKHRRGNYVKRSNIFSIYLRNGNGLKRSSNISILRFLHRYAYMQTVLSQQRNKPESATNIAIAEDNDKCFNMHGDEEQITQCQTKYHAEKSSFFDQCSRVTTEPAHLRNVTNNSNGKAGCSSTPRQTAKRSIDVSKKQPYRHLVNDGNIDSNAGRKILESRREQRQRRPRPWKASLPNTASNCFRIEKLPDNYVNWNKSRSRSWTKIDNSIKKISGTPEANFESGDIQDNTFTLDIAYENSQCKPILNDETNALYLKTSKNNSDILTSQMSQTHTISNVYKGQKMIENNNEMSTDRLRKKNPLPSRIPIRKFPVMKDTQREEFQDPLSCSWKSPYEYLSPPCERENHYAQYIDVNVTENHVDQKRRFIRKDTNDKANKRALVKNVRMGQGTSILKSKQEIAKKVKAMVDSYAKFLEREGVMNGRLIKNRITENGDSNQRNRETDISPEKNGILYHFCQNKFMHKLGKPVVMSTNRFNQNDTSVINSFPGAFAQLASSQLSDAVNSKYYAQPTLSTFRRRNTGPRLSFARESESPSPIQNQIAHKPSVASLRFTRPIQTQSFYAQTQRLKKSKYKESIEKKAFVTPDRKKPFTCRKHNSLGDGFSQLHETQEKIKIQNKEKRCDVTNRNRDQEIKPRGKIRGKNDMNIGPKSSPEADDIRIRTNKIRNLSKSRIEKRKTYPYICTGEATAKFPSGNIIVNTSLSHSKRNDDRQTVTHSPSKCLKILTKVKAPPLTKSLGFDGRMIVGKYGLQTNAKLTSKQGVKGVHAMTQAFSSEKGFSKRHLYARGEDHHVPCAVSLKKGMFSMSPKASSINKNVLTNGNQHHDNIFDSVQCISSSTASLYSEKDILAFQTNESVSLQQSVAEVDSGAYKKYNMEHLPNSSEKWPENKSFPSKSMGTPLTSSNAEQSSLQKFRKTDITEEKYESNRTVKKKTSNSLETLTSSWQSAEPSSFIPKIPCESSLSKSTKGTIFSNAWLQDDKESLATSSGERRHSSPALTAGCVESSKSTMKGISDLTYTSVESLPRDYNNAANKQTDLENITVMSDSALMYLKANDKVACNDINNGYLIRLSQSDLCYKFDPIQYPKGDLPHSESISYSSNSFLSLHSLNSQRLDRCLSKRVTRNTALLRSDKTANKRVHFQVKHLNKKKYGLEKAIFYGNGRDFRKKLSISHCVQPPSKKINTSNTHANKIDLSSCRAPDKTKSENDVQDTYFSLTSSAYQKKSIGSISMTHGSSPRSNTDFQELLNFWEDKVTIKKIKAAHCDTMEISRKVIDDTGKLDKDTGLKGKENCTFTDKFQMQELVDKGSESSHYYSRKKSSYSDRNSSASPCKFYGIPLTRKSFTPQETIRLGHFSLSSLRHSDISSRSSKSVKKRQVKNEFSTIREGRKLSPNAKNVVSLGQKMQFIGEKSKSEKAKRRIQSRSTWTTPGTAEAFITETVQPKCSYNSVMTQLLKDNVQDEQNKVEKNISTINNETIFIAKDSLQIEKTSNKKDQNGYIERNDTHNIPEGMTKKKGISKIKEEAFNSVSNIRQSVSESSLCLEIVAPGSLGPVIETKCKECCASQSKLYETQFLSHSERSVIDLVTAVNNRQEPDTSQNSDADTGLPDVHMDTRDGFHTKGDIAKSPSILQDSSLPISTDVVCNGRSSDDNFISTDVFNGRSYPELFECESKSFSVEKTHSSKSAMMFANETKMRIPQGLNKNSKTENQARAKNRPCPLLCLGESPSNETNISKQLKNKYHSDKADIQNKVTTGQVTCITDATRHCFESTDVISKSSYNSQLETINRTKIAHQIVKLNETSSKLGSITLSTTPHHSAKYKYSTKLCRTKSNPLFKFTQQANKSTKHDFIKNMANLASSQKGIKNKKNETTVASSEIDENYKDLKCRNIKKEKQLTKMDIAYTLCQNSFPTEIIVPDDSKLGQNQSQLTTDHNAQTKNLNVLKESTDHIHVHSNIACTSDEPNKNQANMCLSPLATNKTKLNEFLQLRQNASTRPPLFPSEVNTTLPEKDTHNISKDNITHQGRTKTLINPEIDFNQSELTQNAACFHVPQITFLNENQKQKESDGFKNVHEVEIVIGKDIPVQNFVECFINGLTGNTKISKTEIENKEMKQHKSVRPLEKKTQTQLNTSASNKAGCEPNSRQTKEHTHIVHSSNDSASFVHKMQLPTINLYTRKNNIVRSRRRSTAQRIKKQLRDHPHQSPDSEDSEKTYADIEKGNHDLQASPERKSKFKWKNEKRKRYNRHTQNFDKTKIHYHYQIPNTNKSHANSKRVRRSFLRHYYKGEDMNRQKTSMGPWNLYEQDHLYLRQQENGLKSLNDNITNSENAGIPVDSKYFNHQKEEISLEKKRDLAIQNIQVFAPCCFPTAGKSVQVLVTKEPDYKRVQLTLTDDITNKKCQVIVEPKNKEISLSPQVETKFGFVHVNFYPKSHNETDNNNDHSDRIRHKLQSHNQSKDLSIERSRIRKTEYINVGNEENYLRRQSQPYTNLTNSHRMPAEFDNIQENRNPTMSTFHSTIFNDNPKRNFVPFRYSKSLQTAGNRIPLGSICKGSFSKSFIYDCESQTSKETAKNVDKSYKILPTVPQRARINFANSTKDSLVGFSPYRSEFTSKIPDNRTPFSREVDKSTKLSPCTVERCAKLSPCTTEKNFKLCAFTVDKCTGITPRSSDKCIGMSPYKPEKYTYISPCRPERCKRVPFHKSEKYTRVSSYESKKPSRVSLPQNFKGIESTHSLNSSPVSPIRLHKSTATSPQRAHNSAEIMKNTKLKSTGVSTRNPFEYIEVNPSISLMSPKAYCNSISRENRSYLTKNVSTSPIKIKSFSSNSVPNAVRFGGHGRNCLVEYDAKSLIPEPHFGSHDNMHNQLIHSRLNYKVKTQEPRQSFIQPCCYENMPRRGDGCPELSIKPTPSTNGRIGCRYRSCKQNEGTCSTVFYPRQDKITPKLESHRENVKIEELNKRNLRPLRSGNHDFQDKYLNRSTSVRTVKKIPRISTRGIEINTNLPVSSSHSTHSIPQLSGKDKNCPCLKSRKLHRGCYFRQRDRDLHGRNSVGTIRVWPQNKDNFSYTHGQFPNNDQHKLAGSLEDAGKSDWFDQEHFRDEFDRELSQMVSDEKELRYEDEARVKLQQDDLMDQIVSYPDDNNKYPRHQDVIKGGFHVMQGDCSNFYETYPACQSIGDSSHFADQSRRDGTTIYNTQPIHCQYDGNGYHPTQCQTCCSGINYYPGLNLDQYENRASQSTVNQPQYDKIMYQCTPIQQDSNNTIYQCTPVPPVNENMHKFTQNQQEKDEIMYQCTPNQQGEDNMMYQCAPIQPRNDNVIYQRTPMQLGSDNIMYQRTPMQLDNDNIMYPRTPMQVGSNNIVHQRTPIPLRTDNIIYQRPSIKPGNDSIMHQSKQIQTHHHNIHHPDMNQEIYYYDQHQPNISHQNYSDFAYRDDLITPKNEDDALMALPTQQMDNSYNYKVATRQDYHPTEFQNPESILETRNNAPHKQRLCYPYTHCSTPSLGHPNAKCVSSQQPDILHLSRHCSKGDCVQSNNHEDMRIMSPQTYRRKTQRSSMPTNSLSGPDGQHQAIFSTLANKAFGNEINGLDSSVSREIVERKSNFATSEDKQREYPIQLISSKSRCSRSHRKYNQSQRGFVEGRSISASRNGPSQSISRTSRPQFISRNRPSQSSRLIGKPTQTVSRNNLSQLISGSLSSQSDFSGGTFHPVSTKVQTRSISSNDSYQSISKGNRSQPNSRNNIIRAISGVDPSQSTLMNCPAKPFSTESKQMPLNWIPSPVPSHMPTISSYYNNVTPPIAREDSGYETPEKNVRFSSGINENRPNCSKDKRRVTFMDNGLMARDNSCQAEFQREEEHQSRVYLTTRSPSILAQQNREIQKNKTCDSPPWPDFSEEGNRYDQVNIQTPLSDWDRTVIQNVRKRHKVMNNKYIK